MAIKLLVDVDDVREYMGLSDIPEINDAVQRGLESAHEFFAAVLGTAFDEVIQTTDMFFLDADLHPVRPNAQFALRLKRAFVKNVTAVYDVSRKDAQVSTVAVNTDDIVVDAEKGIVYIDDINTPTYIDGDLIQRLPFDSYRNKWVLVKYDAGFGATNSQVPPKWLTEAILAWMPSVLIKKSDDVDKQVKTALEIKRMAANMVEPHKRESVFHFLPAY